MPNDRAARNRKLPFGAHDAAGVRDRPTRRSLSSLAGGARSVAYCPPSSCLEVGGVATICKECFRAVPLTAVYCPNCGEPVPSQTRKLLIALLVIIGGLALAILSRRS